jgi:DNA-binding NtrC family response regulator
MATGNILIADDDAAIRTVLSQALSRAGYDVRTTGDAATLWRWVQSSEGDLVITDRQAGRKCLRAAAEDEKGPICRSSS